MEDVTLTLLDEFIPTENHLHFDQPYPEMAYATELVAFFEGCTLKCHMKIGEQECDIDLVSGSNRIPVDDRHDTFVLDLYITPEEGQEPLISHMSVVFLDMNPVPINTDDIRFINKPEHGFAMGIEFGYAVDTAKGFDDCFQKEAQIRSPQGQIITVRTSTGNFLWRKDTLLCMLPVAIEYRVRLRYESTGGWGDWSPWKVFVCKRKMSL